jgi:alkylation response protein AidB-like acyl-CoA dehydrogenase
LNFTNGNIADVLFTTIWNEKQLEVFLIEKEEVSQSSITDKLVGFRTGDTGMVMGQRAKDDILTRQLATGKNTIESLKYCFFVERLIVSTMATGVAHGLEDYILKMGPQSLQDAVGDSKQYLQEKVLKLHMTRVQMTSLIETITNRTPADFMQSDSELSILKLMISNELRAAVYSCIEVLGHWALYNNSVMPKVLRDIQMCSFFGGTQELQKISLYSSLQFNAKKGLKVA